MINYEGILEILFDNTLDLRSLMNSDSKKWIIFNSKNLTTSYIKRIVVFQKFWITKFIKANIQYIKITS